jgi:hypothetical protein
MDAKAIVLKHAEACAKELAVEIYLPKIRKVVSDTPNKYDDVVLAALEPLIAEALKKDFAAKLQVE